VACLQGNSLTKQSETAPSTRIAVVTMPVGFLKRMRTSDLIPSSRRTGPPVQDVRSVPALSRVSDFEKIAWRFATSKCNRSGTVNIVAGCLGRVNGALRNTLGTRFIGMSVSSWDRRHLAV